MGYFNRNFFALRGTESVGASGASRAARFQAVATERATCHERVRERPASRSDRPALSQRDRDRGPILGVHVLGVYG
jgi:hypothetical protein